MQKRLKQTKVHQKKRNDPLTFKSGSCKTAFHRCSCYWYNLLRWMSFTLCDNWKTLLFVKVYRYFEIFLTTMLLLSLKPVFWEKPVFYAFSTQQQYDVDTKIPKISKGELIMFFIFVTNSRQLQIFLYKSNFSL